MGRWRSLAILVLACSALVGCRKTRGETPSKAGSSYARQYPPRVASSSVRWVVSEGGAAGFLPAPEGGSTSFHLVGDERGALSVSRQQTGQFSLAVDPPAVCKVLRALSGIDHKRLSLDVTHMGSLDTPGAACIRAFAPSALSFATNGQLGPTEVDLLTHLDGCEAIGVSYQSDEVAKLLGSRAKEPDTASLRTINLVMGQISAEGFAALAQRKNLRELGFRGISAKSRPSGIAVLAELPELERLDLSFGPINDDELASFARATTLRWLSLESTAVGDAGVLPIATRLTALEYVSLMFTKVTDTSVEALAKLPRLRWLRLSGTHVTPKVLDALTRSTTLEVLELPATARGPGVDACRAAHPKVELRVDE